MPIDQAHEQNNALVKGSGGAVGLTDNPTALRKWIISALEQACFYQNLKMSILVKKKKVICIMRKGLLRKKILRNRFFP